ncbi:MAG: EutN/CcmL family microcompartment protein, partial [Clostridiaceae bacterium]|nr:EutN/CcmL family microcompartment protein [Clostridiaceae bacterium]
MFLAKVIGNVISTQKNEKLIGTKLLIIKPIDEEKKILKGAPIVAIDTVGAGIDDTVLVIKGSSASVIYDDKKVPTDAAIIGIVDSIEIDEKYK